MSNGHIDRRIEIDSGIGGLLEKRNGSSCDKEERVYIGVKGVEPLFRRKFGNIGKGVLRAVI